MEAKDNGGFTPLMVASYEGHLDIARLLIERGADMEAKDYDGKTALDWARGKGQTAVVACLEEAARSTPAYSRAPHGEGCGHTG